MPPLKIKENVSLAEFTTFKIGGSAKYYASVKTLNDARKVFEFIRENGLPFVVLGNGSNVLISDQGFSGVVIHNKLKAVELNDREVYAESAAGLIDLARYTIDRGLEGFEYLSGIPATVGGALFMNASFRKKCISDFLISADFLTVEGNLLTLKKGELEFGYRHSSFRGMRGMIIAARFLLSCVANKEDLVRMQNDLLQYRKERHPNGRSAGSVFKNSDTYSAGQLIEECGLKGTVIGGAKISEKHANFIINEKRATAKDVRSLIDLIKKEVFKQKGVLLQEEVCYIGSEPANDL